MSAPVLSCFFPTSWCSRLTDTALVLVPSFGEFEPYNELTWSYFADICVDHLRLPHEFIRPGFWAQEEVPWEKQTASKDRHPDQWITFKNGRVEGRLIIGNLNTISSVWGSLYTSEIEKGEILILDDALLRTARKASILSAEKLFAWGMVPGTLQRNGRTGDG